MHKDRAGVLASSQVLPSHHGITAGTAKVHQGQGQAVSRCSGDPQELTAGRFHEKPLHAVQALCSAILSSAAPTMAPIASPAPWAPLGGGVAARGATRQRAPRERYSTDPLRPLLSPARLWA